MGEFYAVLKQLAQYNTNYVIDNDNVNDWVVFFAPKIDFFHECALKNKAKDVFKLKFNFASNEQKTFLWR